MKNIKLLIVSLIALPLHAMIKEVTVTNELEDSEYFSARHPALTEHFNEKIDFHKEELIHTIYVNEILLPKGKTITIPAYNNAIQIAACVERRRVITFRQATEVTKLDLQGYGNKVAITQVVLEKPLVFQERPTIKSITAQKR